MSFPLNPTNGQLVSVNGVAYTYNSTVGAWQVTTQNQSTSVTINGSTVSLNGSVTVTAVNPNALTLGSYLTGSSYTGAAAITAAVDATTTATASKVVARDANGDDYRRYGYGEYFNMSHGASGATTDTIFYSSTDNFIRKNDATGFRASLNVPTRTGGDASGTWGISITGSASTVTTAAQGNITSVGTLTSLTMGGTITGVTGSASSFNGGTCAAADYNYILSGGNDTGNKAVMFVNGSSRTADGGANGLTFRNDGGPLTLGNGSTATNLSGSAVNITATTSAYHINPAATNTYDLGTASLRWRNIYTQDLHLNNGIGDWTIVEGEDDLFLYNNKRNKVYKFNLTEVDPATAVPKIDDLNKKS